MRLSTDITLRGHTQAKFPDKCIVCHGIPDSTTRITQNRQNPFLGFLAPILYFFGWSRVEIPICRKCKVRFRLQRWGRQIGCWVLILIAVWFIYPRFGDWSPLIRKITVGLLVLLAIAPYALLETIWPPIFDTYARKDSVDYQFASSEYAEEFYELNEERVLKSEVYQ